MLFIYKRRRILNQLCILFGVFDDNDGHQRRQTFRLLLGLRYKQIVTLKRTNISFAGVRDLSGFPALCYTSDYLLTLQFGYIGVRFSAHSVIIAPQYIQDLINLRSSHPNLLEISRYRKAVYRALWVQLALAFCYLPYNILIVVARKTFSSHIVVTKEIAIPLLYFSST